MKTLHEVEGLDLKDRRVQIRSVSENVAWWEPFDHLMLATGALPVRLDVPGSDADGIYGVDTLQAGIAVRKAVDEQKPKRAVIVGGGYIGLEMAEAFALRQMEVSLVEMAEQVMNTLDPDMGALVSDALIDVGVKLYRKESLQGFEVEDGRVSAVATDQRTIPADLVVLGMGVKPNAALAKEAGIPLGARGAVKVNDLMQTEAEGVWAGGDCAQSFHLVSRRPFYVALGTVANKHGRVAGINIGGGYATFPGVVGTAVSKICKVEVARTGLQEKEIEALGLHYVSARIESTTRANYFPGSGQMTVKILAEKGTGRLLGGQIVGKEGAAKRIDVIATSLHAGFTLEEMVYMDLSYAPPFSPLWDPVLIAARKTLEKV